MDLKPQEHTSCDPSTVPAMEQLCNTQECPAWRHGEWGQCSCGRRSRRHRWVECRWNDGGKAPEGLCTYPQPHSSQACPHFMPCQQHKPKPSANRLYFTVVPISTLKISLLH